MVEGEVPARWSERPWLGRALRLTVAAIPLLSGLAVALGLSLVLPPPAGLPAAVARWVVLSATATVVVIVVDRFARRLLPLAALLQLNLAFPGAAPSRYRIARESATTRGLAEDVRRAREEGLSDDRTQAAASVLRLVSALSLHDKATRGHAERTRVLADMIAAELELSQEDLDRLRWASLIHDVGKITVHPQLLNKDDEPTPEEWDILRRHPEEGARLTAPLRTWLGAWALTIEQHHEKWDGSGYPHGLAGREIHLGARIVAVADAFDVMTAARAYRDPISAKAAREELAACAGTHFDPLVVRAFLAVPLRDLRLVVGPLSWLATLPMSQPLTRVPSSAAASIAVAVATVAVVGTGGLALPEQPDEPVLALEVGQDGAGDTPSAEPAPFTPPETRVLGQQEARAPDPPTPPTPPSDPVVSQPALPDLDDVIPAPQEPSPVESIAPRPRPAEPVAPVAPDTAPPAPPTDTPAPVDPEPVGPPVPTPTDSGSSTPPPPPPTDPPPTDPGPSTPPPPPTEPGPSTPPPPTEPPPTDAGPSTPPPPPAPTDAGPSTPPPPPPPPPSPAVAAPPAVAADDAVEVDEDGTVTFDLFANDTDPAGNGLSLLAIERSDPGLGDLVDHGDGTVTYRPFADVAGTEQFVYRVDDGRSSATAAVTIVIRAVNDAPVVATDRYEVANATPLEVTAAEGLLSNDADVDGDALQVVPGSVSSVAPEVGTLAVEPDGAFRFVPAADASGPLTVTYEVSDGTVQVPSQVEFDIAASPPPPAWHTSGLFLTGSAGPDGVGVLSPTEPAPGTGEIPDWDSDGAPGRTIGSSGLDEDESDPTLVQEWLFTLDTDVELDGAVELDLTSAVADLRGGETVRYSAYVYRCDADGQDCTRLVASHNMRVADWNEEGAWSTRTLRIGTSQRTLLAGSTLRVKLLFEDADIWLPLTAELPSVLRLTPAP